MNARAEKYISDHNSPIVKKPEPFGSKLLLSSLNEEQKNSLDNYLNELERILSHDRVDRRCARSVAEWIPEQKLAKVTKITKGSARFGFQNKTGKFLNPEETLFLLEMNKLELKHNNMPVSIEQAFKFIDNLDKYLLYKKMTLQGYKLKQENPNKEKSDSTFEEGEPPNKIAKIAENEKTEIDEIFIKLREKGPKATSSGKCTDSFDYLIKMPSFKTEDIHIKLIDNGVLENASSASGNVNAIPFGSNLALMKLSNENIPILK